MTEIRKFYLTQSELKHLGTIIRFQEKDGFHLRSVSNIRMVPLATLDLEEYVAEFEREGR